MWGQKRAAATDRHAGLLVNDSVIAAACVEGDANDIRKLTVSISPHAGGDDTRPQALRSHIGDVDLNRSQLTSVLPGGTYQLLLVELPKVPAAEINSAVRWQIKDLLEFPVDEAVIELFDIPESSNAGKAPMAYAIATRHSTLQQHVDRIHEAGLPLGAIDIPELCMRNIASLLPQDVEGVALLHFTEDRGMLTITRGGLLYVIRHIDMGWHAFGSADEHDPSVVERLSAVALDVQRSLDYYESHYDCRPIKELVLDPMERLGQLPGLLHDQFGLSVSPLDLNKHFELIADIPSEHQGTCLLAIGAALRKESLAA